ncbi:MAG TPA: S49 family peptidase, partial [Pyrinomonadaceae bacterium]|nr:S49 family peptidase [Pyrinomonadaceae bacterium]
ITGSIGVVAGKPVMKGLYDWLGITNEYVLRPKEGGSAGMFRETEQFNKQERDKFEGWINATYQDFISKVAKGRNMQVNKVDEIGQGRVWTGAQGKTRGIVDEYGGLDRAVQVAKELAGIGKDKGVHRVILPAPRTLIQEWLNLGDDDGETRETPELKQQRAVLAVLPEDARRAFRYAALLDKMKSGDAALVMPFDLRIK